jgi:aldose 1-epimerase
VFHRNAEYKLAIVFETTAGKLGRCDTHKLLNTETGEHVVIISAAGATLNEMTTRIAGEATNIVDGYEDEEDFVSHHSIEFKGAKLSPFPNRINKGRYRFDGKDYQLDINFLNEGHSIHGLLYDAPFTEVETWSTQEEAGVELSYRYAGDAPGYPFEFTANLWFTYKSNQLTCRTVVMNTGSYAMPLGDGWHPYFTTGSPLDDLHLQFPATHRIEVGADMIPHGRSPKYNRFHSLSPLEGEHFDDCFRLEETVGTARTVLNDPRQGIALTVWQETGKEKYNYLQIYTPPGRKSVALEPMTCPPDAFNNGIDLIRLVPQEKVSFSWGIEVAHPDR